MLGARLDVSYATRSAVAGDPRDERKGDGTVGKRGERARDREGRVKRREGEGQRRKE